MLMLLDEMYVTLGMEDGIDVTITVVVCFDVAVTVSKVVILPLHR